jgi:hypothetical protein
MEISRVTLNKCDEILAEYGQQQHHNAMTTAAATLSSKAKRPEREQTILTAAPISRNALIDWFILD